MKQQGRRFRSSILDSGFSNIAENEGKRLINKDGTFNVKKSGMFFLERFSVFHWLIKMSWLRFFIIMFLGYVLINFLFAGLYFIGGIEGLSGDHSLDKRQQFLEAFYFSSQTLTTVGFGYLSPISTYHSLLATFESFIGLMSFAMATGLLYGKFSKPKSGIIFSRNALISPYKEGEKGLMIRLANSKENHLINAKAVMMISWIDPNSLGQTRKYYGLPLEISTISMLAASWTLVHPVNEESPIYNLTMEELSAWEAEVILQLEAYDETYSHQIHARTSYKYNEFVWGAKFVPILGHDEGYATLKMDDLGHYEKVDLTN